MRRVLVIAASSFSLAACSSFSLPSFEMPSFSAPAATSTLEFESEPAGAEVKTSTNQTCRTPCALAVPANDLTVTFSLNGYTPQTVPVRMSSPGDGRDPMTGQVPAPTLSPNPVYVELVMAPPVRRPPPPTAAKPAAKKKPKTTAKPKPPATSATGTEPMASSPATPPSSPWPAPQQR